ncbi:MAG: pyridoxine 5'-phosphate synthase [Muribaculum sp.]|nr:pyridoxine 5'-phosphate synthase [Muribaculum sp.]
MTRLSVNINKVATLRNARGENNPDVVKFAKDCEAFGAQGITVHPRPDERHIRRSDVDELKPVITTEFNIEGYPDKSLMDLLLRIRPDQATLVPDAPSQLTSNSGWDVVNNADTLRPIVKRLKDAGIRVSIFVDPDPAQIKAAAAVGADRVELYTKPYADLYPSDPQGAVAPFIVAAKAAADAGLGLNAGHDLSLQNLAFFHRNIPNLDEVSIGHALICDALYLGIERTIQGYLDCLHG